MDSVQFDISFTPVKVFLDKVDAVLNSNTFLLQFEVKTDDINNELLNFIRSESFMHQIANQDKVRGWFNMHYFDHKTEAYKLRSGNILKDKIDLKVKEIENEKSEYLIAMLTGGTTKGPFFSFYSKHVNSEKAKAIVDNLISFLSVQSNWRLLVITPDFLKDAVDVYSKDEDLRYFGGDYANDTATLILTGNKGSYC